MNHHIFHMPLHELGTALGIGVVLGLIYMYLLWMTVQTLLKVKHKGLFIIIVRVENPDIRIQPRNNTASFNM